MQAESQKMTPVPVTRGSDPQSLSQKVHWIAGTFKRFTPVELPSILSQKFIPTKAFNGYTVGSLFDDGHKVFQNPERPEMGVHFQWDGDACDACPIDPTDLIIELQRAKFAFTRIDMAIDAVGFNLRPQRATEEINNGRVKTLAKKCPFWGDPRDPGYTQYVGKKTSEIFVKLYDKAAEMGVSGDHARIELTVRYDRANKAAQTLVSNRDFRGLVVAYVDFPEWETWREIMAVTPTKLPAERKTSQTKLWLLRSAASALAKQMVLDGDDTFYFQFLDAVRVFHQQFSDQVQDSKVVH